MLNYLEIEKYDDGYTVILFYDEEGLFQFYGLEYSMSDTFLEGTFWYNNMYYSGLNWMAQLEFQDTTETVMVYSMHEAIIAAPYFFVSLFLSMLMLLPVIIYVWRRMRYVGKVKEEILIMADGDLEHPVTVKGRDEIGVLARNLDEMRLALEENIRQEQEGKKANHNLIRSVSHDLRTPMTTLYGYLEILDQKKCPAGKQEEYIRRCIEKVEEIRALSDKMFEYALVYGQKEQEELTELFLWELLEEMESSREFLQLNGFQIEEEFLAPEEVKFRGNRIFFQRAFFCSGRRGYLCRYHRVFDRWERMIWKKQGGKQMREQLTRSDVKKIEEEIEYRKLVVRKEAIEAVKGARAHGDLSENFEYHAAKKDKNKNESRIRYLERMLKTAVIVSDASKEDEVGINNTVTVYFEEDEEEQVFRLVTSIRGNSMKNLISTESPLGKAILGHKAGDRVQIKVSDDYSYYVVIRKIENTSEDEHDAIRGF